MDLTMESFLNPASLWMILGVILLILEFVIPGLLVVFFGAGAILTGLLSLFLPWDINQQILFFMVSSVVLLLALRKLLKPLMTGGVLGEHPDVDSFNGQQARVTVAIDPPKSGKVEFNGSDWSARALSPIPKDSLVTIVERENLTLLVKPLS